MQYRPNLDGIRGLAIALVMVFHYNYFFEFGWVGVQIFFVLSGYLITSILLESKHRTLGDYLKRFYKRRALRIFPIYYLYLMLVMLAYLMIHKPDDFAVKAPWLFTYTYNLYPLFKGFGFDIFFTHFWSLCVEEQFYLMWPLMIFFLSMRQLGIVLIGFIIGAPLVRLGLGEYLFSINTPHDFVGQIVYRFTFSHWDGFAFGAIIPVFSLNTFIRKPSKFLLMTVGVFLMVGWMNYQSLRYQDIAVAPSSLGYAIGIMENNQMIWSYSLLGILSMLLILFCTEQHSPIADKLFGNRVMVFLGKISYGLYVYHWIIWMGLNKYLKDQPFPVLAIGFVLFISLSIGVAYLSYIIIERPLLAKKENVKIKIV